MQVAVLLEEHHLRGEHWVRDSTSLGPGQQVQQLLVLARGNDHVAHFEVEANVPDKVQAVRAHELGLVDVCDHFHSLLARAARLGGHQLAALIHLHGLHVYRAVQSRQHGLHLALEASLCFAGSPAEPARPAAGPELIYALDAVVQVITAKALEGQCSRTILAAACAFLKSLRTEDPPAPGGGPACRWTPPSSVAVYLVQTSTVRLGSTSFSFLSRSCCSCSMVMALSTLSRSCLDSRRGGHRGGAQRARSPH